MKKKFEKPEIAITSNDAVEKCFSKPIYDYTYTIDTINDIFNDSLETSSSDTNNYKDLNSRFLRNLLNDDFDYHGEINDNLDNNSFKLDTQKQADMVNNPPHYTQGGIECIDAIEAMISGYNDPIDATLSWQIVKYIWRHPFKGKPIEDLKKARFYLDRLIKHLDTE